MAALLSAFHLQVDELEDPLAAPFPAFPGSCAPPKPTQSRVGRVDSSLFPAGGSLDGPGGIAWQVHQFFLPPSLVEWPISGTTNSGSGQCVPPLASRSFCVRLAPLTLDYLVNSSLGPRLALITSHEQKHLDLILGFFSADTAGNPNL